MRKITQVFILPLLVLALISCQPQTKKISRNKHNRTKCSGMEQKCGYV